MNHDLPRLLLGLCTACAPRRGEPSDLGNVGSTLDGQSGDGTVRNTRTNLIHYLGLTGLVVTATVVGASSAKLPNGA